MAPSSRGVAISLVIALLCCSLAGCSLDFAGDKTSQSSAVPGLSDENNLDEPERSEEAKKVLVAAMGGGGFVARTMNDEYWDEREWRLVSESQIHSFLSGLGENQEEKYEYSYDDYGYMVSCTKSDNGVLEREYSWKTEDDITTRVVTDYEKSPEGAVTRMVKEDDGKGGSVETTYDESGAVVQTAEVTHEEDIDGYTQTHVRRDASGVVDFTKVSRYDADGSLLSSRSYDGEPSDLTLESETTYVHDEQGRDTDSYSENPGYEYGYANGESHTAYARDGSSVTIDVDGLSGGYYADIVTFTVESPDGRVLRRYRNLSADEFTTVAPENFYALYNEVGNPTLVVSERGNCLASKCSFDYDESGNLISGVEAEFDSSGELNSVTYYVFQYENVSTGEMTEVPAIESLLVPELTGEDAELALNRYGDCPLDRVVYGEGQWQADIGPDKIGTRNLVVNCMSIVPGQPLILVATTREGGMAIENESVGHYEAMENGEVLLVTYTGAKLSLSDATEDTVRVSGTLADGTEVNATAKWVPRDY